MKYNSVQLRTAELMKKYKPTINGSYDAKRYAEMERLLKADLIRLANGQPTDCGLYGKVFELASHDSKSTITRVQSQNKNDVYILTDGKRVKGEAKTGGGRIGKLFNMNSKEKANTFFVFDLDHTPADRTLKDGTIVKGVRRKATKITTVEHFIDIVIECKAYKMTGHKGQSDYEEAIQISSKKLYEAMKSLPDFDRNTVYSI